MEKKLANKKDGRENIYLIIGMLFTFLFYSLFLLRKVPLHTSSDELGTIAGAAYLAGRNWGGVINGCGYYGMGYYVLFAPLFMLTDNPIIIYRLILFFNVILRVLIVWIAFRIFTEFVIIKSSKIKILISVLCALMYSTRISSISNEFVLELLIWIVLYLCCKIIHNSNKVKQKNIYAFLLLLSLGYGLLVHTRWITVIIAVAITFIILLAVYKKMFFPLWQVLLFALIYWITNHIITTYQSFIWNTEGTLRNSSVTIEKGIHIFDINTWRLWLNIVAGNIGAMTIFTGGLFVIAVVAFVYILICNIRKKEKPNVFWGTINISMILCIGATVVGLMVSYWFSGMLPSFSEGKVGLNEYAYKGLTYLRYWEIYVPPVIGCALAVIYEKRICSLVARIGAAFTIFTMLLFVQLVLPLIENNQSALEPLYALGFFKDGDTVNINNYLAGISVVLVIEFVVLLCLWKKNVIGAILVFISLFLFQYSFATVNYDNKVSKRMNDKINVSVSLFRECEKQSLLFENIYGLSDKNVDNNWKICYILQFCLNRETIQNEIPAQFEKEDLVIVNKKEVMADFPEARCIQIDNDEYWFVFDEKRYEDIEMLVQKFDKK